MDDDRAPRWLVRWMRNAALIAAACGAGYAAYRYFTAPDRQQAEQIRRGCEAAAAAGHPCD